MTDEQHIKDKPTYIMVPRKLLITWITTSVVMAIMVLASFQYTGYVDRRSNRLWCGIINLFDETYKKAPPPSQAGQIFAREFSKLRVKFNCE